MTKNKTYKATKNFFLSGDLKEIGNTFELTPDQYNDCRNRVVEVKEKEKPATKKVK